MTTKFLLSSDDNTRSGLLKKKIIHYYMANGDATIATLENKRLAEGVSLVFTGSIPHPAILWA